MLTPETTELFATALNGPYAVGLAVVGAALFATFASKYL